MTAENSREAHTCSEMVGEPPGYWHHHECGRPAKYVLTNPGGYEIRVCGVHRRSLIKHGYREAD